MPTPANFQVVATTDPGGTALVNGTPTLLTWTAPNDGHFHMVLVSASELVTVTTTGGIITALVAGNTLPLIGGSLGAGAIPYASNGAVCLLPSGGTINIVQTALTGGAAVVTATIMATQ